VIPIVSSRAGLPVSASVFLVAAPTLALCYRDQYGLNAKKPFSLGSQRVRARFQKDREPKLKGFDLSDART